MSFVTMFLIAMAFIVCALFTIWIVQRYLSVNYKGFTSQVDVRRLNTHSVFDKQAKNKHYVDTSNIGIAGDDVITESNNELSQKVFDGVNQNPEHRHYNSAKTNTTRNRETTALKDTADLAYESIANQEVVSRDKE
jgi:hypothetical protein